MRCSSTRIRADERVDRVVLEHRHRRLQDDRTVVELACHEVHGRAGDADAVLERLPLRVEAGKRRQQRRMDVEDAMRETRRAAARRPVA